MKILWHSASPALPTAKGLQAKYALEILNELSERGEIDVQLAVSAYYGETAALSYHPIRRAPYDPSTYTIPLYGNPHASVDPWGSISLERAIRHFEPDAVIIFAPASVAPVNSARSYGKPVLLWTTVDHDPMPQAAWAIAETAELLASPSQNGLEVMQAAPGLDPILIPHMVAEHFFNPPDKGEARQQRFIDVSYFVFGMVGANLGLPPRKGFVEAIEAFSRVVEEGAEYARLFLWTDTNPPWPNTVNLSGVAQRFGVEHLIFAPSRDSMLLDHSDHGSLASVYGSMDALLAPTYGEGFGTSIAEAMAASVPVIAPRHTGLLNWRGGITLHNEQPHWTNQDSFFMKPDVAELTTAMVEMITAGPEGRAAFGQEGREQAAMEYSREAVKPYWVAAIEHLEQIREDKSNDD